MKLITGRNGSNKVVVGDVNVKKVQHKHKNFHQTFFTKKIWWKNVDDRYKQLLKTNEKIVV